MTLARSRCDRPSARPGTRDTQEGPLAAGVSRVPAGWLCDAGPDPRGPVAGAAARPRAQLSPSDDLLPATRSRPRLSRPAAPRTTCTLTMTSSPLIASWSIARVGGADDSSTQSPETQATVESSWTTTGASSPATSPTRTGRRRIATPCMPRSLGHGAGCRRRHRIARTALAPVGWAANACSRSRSRRCRGCRHRACTGLSEPTCRRRAVRALRVNDARRARTSNLPSSRSCRAQAARADKSATPCAA